MKGIKNIIFDLGGVVVELDVKGCMEGLEEVGVGEVGEWMRGRNEKGLFKEYEWGRVSREEFGDGIWKEVGGEVGGEEIDEIWNGMLKDIGDYKLELLLKVEEKYKLYLLSNRNDLDWEDCGDKLVYKGMEMVGWFRGVFV